IPQRPRPTLFPYTTLFRSVGHGAGAGKVGTDIVALHLNPMASVEHAIADIDAGDSVAGDHVAGPGFCPSQEAGRPNEHHASAIRSEEHTSELQSRGHLVCR